MKAITKIRLENFKRFEQFTLAFDPELNLLIGDNECGKSSVLTAIDLVLSGSRNRVEAAGLEYLFNKDVISRFMASDRQFANLPQLRVELYLNEQNNPETNGRNNRDGVICDGLRLICAPDDRLHDQIRNILQQPSNNNFPFDYYAIQFSTFADIGYTGHRKFVKHLLIDNAQVTSEYAMREYVKDIYEISATTLEKYQHQHEYRVHKDGFTSTALSGINNRMRDGYTFGIKSNSKANLQTDLTILEHSIGIDNKGKGRQCFVKTDLAIQRGESNLEVVLMEEPENHLSHGNTRRLISRIAQANDKQLFIATHSNLISTRLDLRRTILLNSANTAPVLLKNLPEDTAHFFMKAPDNNILEFVLSKRVILVEGDAEFILMDLFFRKATSTTMEAAGVHVISVDGTSFKRYLDITKILQIKTLVIRDNDGDFQGNCVDNYTDYQATHVQIAADGDNSRPTFEICLYQDNTSACDDLFAGSRRTLTVQTFMLKNKADAAFQLLQHKADVLVVPTYIKDALVWINA